MAVRPIGTIFSEFYSTYTSEDGHYGHFVTKRDEERTERKFIVCDHADDYSGNAVEIIKPYVSGECQLCGGFHGCNTRCQQ